MTHIPVHNEPTDMNVGTEEKAKAKMNEETGQDPNQSTNDADAGETTWMEEIEIAGSQLVERVKELITEGNVRRLILRTHDDKLIMEIPLTAGAVFGSVVTFFAPLVAALGALAALLAKVKVQIVRVEDKSE